MQHQPPTPLLDLLLKVCGLVTAFVAAWAVIGVLADVGDVGAAVWRQYAALLLPVLAVDALLLGTRAWLRRRA
jgi:hypothetical protein